MVYKWSDLVGQSVANLYVIRAVHAEQPDRAAFKASTADDDVPVLLELVVPDSPDFHDQRECWQTAMNVQHENLTRILATGETVIDGGPVLFCAKELHDDELAAVLDSRALTAEEATDVLKAVLPCLDQIHRSHCVHGSIAPSSILAFGDRVKLAADTIRRSGPAEPVSDDIHAVGLLVMEMLTGRYGTAPHMDDISKPLRDIIAACMDSKRRQSLTAAALMNVLNSVPEAPVRPAPVPDRPRPAAAGPPRLAEVPTAVPPGPAPAPVQRRRSKLPVVAGLVAASLLIATIVLSRRAPEPSATPAVATKTQDVRPSPAVAKDPAAQTQRPAAPLAPVPVPGGWAVIAATYSNFDAAQKRADTLRRQWQRCECSVYPEKGQGRKYYVLVGAGLTKDAAERLHRGARASRLPSDTYVTRLQDGGTRARRGR